MDVRSAQYSKSATHLRPTARLRLRWFGCRSSFRACCIGIALIKLFNRPGAGGVVSERGIRAAGVCDSLFRAGWTAARHAVASVDKDLTDAARLEGASRWQMFRFVIWPQIAPQMFAAWYVVYLLCLWDVESIVLVQPPGGETLALQDFQSAALRATRRR